MDPKMYDDVPWARLARQAGFEPIHTELSTRVAFDFAAQKISDLELELARERKSRPLIKHKKRGTTYEVLGAGKIQTDHPLTDYAEVTVYRSVDDGQVWVRPIDEINDPDRFEDVSSSDNMPERSSNTEVDAYDDVHLEYLREAYDDGYASAQRDICEALGIQPLPQNKGK